jgi:hypothetical protein
MARVVSVLGKVALLIALGARGAAALPVVFTDEGQFNAAVAGAGLAMTAESFEGVPAGFQSGLDLGAFTLQPFTPLPLVFVSDDPATATDGTHAIATEPIQAPTFSFGTGIRAFSIDIIGALDANGGYFIVDIGDDFEQVVFSGLERENAVRFIGILDLDAPFTSLTFNSTDFVDIFAMDRVQYDAAAAPVPEPASLALVGGGLIGIVRRRFVRSCGR